MASASMRSIETGRSKLLRSERVAVTTIEGAPEDSPCADPVWAPAGRAKVPAPRASRAAGHEAVIRCAMVVVSRAGGARLPSYPVAPRIERGYDAITLRRLHRSAPSKTTTPGKRRIFHVASPVPIAHLPRFRARLRAH